MQYFLPQLLLKIFVLLLLDRISIFLKPLRKKHTFKGFPNNHLFLYTAFLVAVIAVALADLIPKI